MIKIKCGSAERKIIHCQETSISVRANNSSFNVHLFIGQFVWFQIAEHCRPASEFSLTMVEFFQKGWKLIATVEIGCKVKVMVPCFGKLRARFGA